ncbi:MAG: aldo/keto reductase [Spirochaetaceae bacterium]|nr:MAG: aldo/keto reductase [Spirochaetaceae bacterium]
MEAAGYALPPIINGCWQLSAGHRSDTPERDAAIDGLVRRAQAGLTAFDGADIYTGVEEMLGEVRDRYVAAGGAREDIRTHTKFVPDRDALTRVDRDYVTRIIDRSLSRLRVERLDLIQFHWWEYGTPGAVDAAGHLVDLQNAGKIGLIGTTNFNTIELAKLLDAGIPIVSNQVQYSLLDRRPEPSMVDLCRATGVRLFCYGSLAGGFLSDRYLGAKPPDAFGNRSLVKYRLIIDEFGGWQEYQRLLSVAAEVAAKHGVGIANVAARYAIDRPCVAAAIVGVRGSDHLEETLATLSFALDADDQARLDAAAPSRVPGDCFDLERVPDGPHQRIMKMNLNDKRSLP